MHYQQSYYVHFPISLSSALLCEMGLISFPVRRSGFCQGTDQVDFITSSTINTIPMHILAYLVVMVVLSIHTTVTVLIHACAINRASNFMGLPQPHIPSGYGRSLVTHIPVHRRKGVW